MFLWGSNARDAHPIWFHHLLKGIQNGARLHVVDPRRTSSAEWADVWLGLNVGSDIALSNAMAREIIHAGLHDETFIARGTTGFEAFRDSVEPYTLELAAAATGIPADVIRDSAHQYAKADRAMICWTLGITEHHNAVDNVVSLINLALLTGHVGRYGCGCNPLRGQNNVQGGGDMGALPNKLPGFQDVDNPEHRTKFERVWKRDILPEIGLNLTEMMYAMEHKELTALYVIGENPAQSDADATHVAHLLDQLDHLVVQEIFLTKTAQLAHVVFPATATWAEGEGTVTNSERRVQRVRKAVEPPGEARDELWIMSELAKRMGRGWGHPSAEDVWDELRSLSPDHAGMSYARLDALGGLQWPCRDETDPGTLFLHARLWDEDPAKRGRLAPFSVVQHEGPVEQPSDEYPLTLTTGRRLESYNTGVQTGGYLSPLHRGESLDLSPEDAARLGIEQGDMVQVTSRRGTVQAPAHIDRGLRAGVVFMTLHFPDAIATNLLTINATDPRSGTAEFKACAVRVEPIRVAHSVGARRAEPFAAAGDD
ncbi:MAG: formate dehydrogenase [Gemmatimonadetes bacterium]|nr:formate dehydrogenase [Gemmatimonadota bacterium]